MTNMTKPIKKQALIAGLFFLLMVVSGLFSEIFVRQKLIIANDAIATSNNILSHPLLYRSGITSDIIMTLFYLFTALALYCLLESINKKLASVMVIFASLGCVMLLFNVLYQALPLYILQGGDYLNTIPLVERQAFAMFFSEIFNHGYMLGQVFFALWVLPLGILIYRSAFIPKIFGLFFIVEAVFALFAVFVHFLIPNASVETLLLVPGIVAEFSFLFWLLFQGLSNKKRMAE